MAPMALLLLFLCSLPLSSSSDTITFNQSLSTNTTLVSKQGLFELGFFSPGTSPNLYLGIWYKNVPQRTIVWVANRDTPLSNLSNPELHISTNGTLAITATHSTTPIWTSSNPRPTTPNNAYLTLQDSGNLILQDGSDVLWQSFDHPTDTALPGAKIGYNKTSGLNWTLTSWTSPDDPSPGNYTLLIDPNGGNQVLMLWNGSTQYFSSGLWDGKIFANIPEMTQLHQYGIERNSSNGAVYYWYIDHDTDVSGMVMTVTGQLNWKTWVSDQHKWQVFTYLPRDACEVAYHCGSFAGCVPFDPSCTCLPGFAPRSPAEWNSGVQIGGCVRNTPLACRNASDGSDGFVDIADVIGLPTGSSTLDMGDDEKCAGACLDDCSCTAYYYNGTCLVWYGELNNLKQASNNNAVGTGEKLLLHLRLAAPDLTNNGGTGKNSRNDHVLPIAVALGGTALVAVAVIAVLIWRRNNRRKGKPTGFPVAYRYKDLHNATRGFKEVLGVGGFGSVYKGVLEDKMPVAVKKLEKLGQGEKQFRTEVTAMATVQHVNIMQLRGFCCQGLERLLVYDYLSKGSLDNYLFPKSSNMLSWGTRFQIALGVARGLAYLHEKCQDCIIHCDLKPENILLDDEFRPKVADFGMAKLVGRNFNQVITTMRGTVGYLAPEWISGLPITAKADVYSYGMMLFEIVSGRRNMEGSEGEGSSMAGFFPMWAARSVVDGEASGGVLEGDAEPEEVRRACRVACWCVQDDESSRPMMGEVVRMLEGVTERGVPAIPKNLRNLVPDEESLVRSLTVYSLVSSS